MSARIDEAAAAMLHAVTNPLVVKLCADDAKPTPTEEALLDALAAAMDLATAWAKKANAEATEGPNSSGA